MNSEYSRFLRRLAARIACHPGAAFGLAAVAAIVVSLNHSALANSLYAMFPDGQPIVFDATTWVTGDIAPKQKSVQVQRSPIVGGTCSLTATVTSDATDLMNIRILTGDDTDRSGAIDAGEWTQIAAAAATAYGSGMRAIASAVNVSANKQGYRIEHTWTWGISYDDLVDRSLQ